MKKPKSVYEIDGNIILSEDNGREYGNKPLKVWDSDLFAEYILDNSTMNCEVCDNYFMIEGSLIKGYFEDLPRVTNPRVLLYGIFEVVRSYF
jgi:hypothetical protein